MSLTHNSCAIHSQAIVPRAASQMMMVESSDALANHLLSGDAMSAVSLFS